MRIMRMSFCDLIRYLFCPRLFHKRVVDDQSRLEYESVDEFDALYKEPSILVDVTIT